MITKSEVIRMFHEDYAELVKNCYVNANNDRLMETWNNFTQNLYDKGQITKHTFSILTSPV